MKMLPLVNYAPLVNGRVAEFEGTLPYLSTGGLNVDVIENTELVTYQNRPSRADLSLQIDNVICARMKETCKVLRVDHSNVNHLVSTGFAVHKPLPDKLDSNYLAIYMKTQDFQRQKDKYCTGATQKAITNNGIKKLEIPIPYPDNPSKSFAEQKRIATILNQADSIRKKRQLALDQLDKLVPAIFHDMFGDPVSNSKNWPLVSLNDYGEVITGNTPSRQHPDYYGDFIEWIKSDNINTPFHFLTEATEKLSEKGKAVGRVAPKGSTLVTCIAGSPSCIGNAAMADRDVAFNQQINAICPSKETDEFFLYYLIVMIKKLIQRASTASMKGLVSKSSFSAIKTINIPPDMQFEFGKKMKKLIQSNLLLNQTALEANDLFNSLAQRAFKGVL